MFLIVPIAFISSFYVEKAIAQEKIKVGALLEKYEAPAQEDCDINVPSQYTTIQAGIDASVIGDTVCVGPGTYNESINILKSIQLSGSGATDTVVNGIYIAGDGNADNVIVEGFLVLSVGNGAGLNDPTPFNIGPFTSGTIIRHNKVVSGNAELVVRADSGQSNMLIYNNIFEGNNSPVIFKVSGVQGPSYKVDFINNTFTGTVNPTNQDNGRILETWATDGLIQGNIFNATGVINTLIASSYPSNIISENNLNSIANIKIGTYSGGTLNAENNWWGDLDPSNSIWGDIDYTPFADSPFEQDGVLISTCTSWTYSGWSTCSSAGQQTRTVTSSSPSGCSGGSPTISQSCTYTPPTCGQTVSYGGQNYNTVQIGDQCWFGENLNVGSKINTTVKHSNDSVIEKYCYEDNNLNCDVYGGLYNWDEAIGYSSVNGAQGICPTGWHLPTDSEWGTLSSYAGTDASEKLKIGTPLWNGLDTYNFSVLPGGDSINGTSYGQGEVAYFWSSTLVNTSNAYDRIIGSGMLIPDRRSDQKALSFSVRCIADSFKNVPSCTFWEYSDWSSCSSSGNQTRTVTSSSPSSCTGGSPVTSQSCTYTPPTSTCSSWAYSNWGTCSSSGNQTRSVVSSSPNGCSGGSPTLQQSCTYTPPCTADTWVCGDWNSCSFSGIQNRSCERTFDCSSVEDIPPTTSQYCEAPNKPKKDNPHDSDAIANQDTIIKATVKLLCPFDEQWASQGSGTVIDSDGTILTNKHVVEDTLGCLVGFIDSFSDEPYFGDRQIADIQKMSSSEDIAILKLRNPDNKKLTYINIDRGNINFKLGDNINIYGYPAQFGTNLTYTSGDFSGISGNYLKTTAIIEYGNSGGGAYFNNGKFIGMPTAVIKGELNALGYILSANVINAWLGNSTIASNDNNKNKYSRVSSVLENINLGKLDSLELIVSGTKESKEVIEKIIKVPSVTSKDVVEQTPVIKVNVDDKKQDVFVKNKDEDESSQKKEEKKSQINQVADEPNEIKQDHESQTLSTEIDESIEEDKNEIKDVMEKILQIVGEDNETGEQVMTMIKGQNQEKLEVSLQKVQSRGGFSKFFLGPNYSEIDNAKKLLEQNREQIKQIDEIQNQIINNDDKQELTEQVKLLEQANQEIEDSLNISQKGFSLLGWVFRLFSN